MPKKHLGAAQQVAVDGVITREVLQAAQLNRHLGDRSAREGRGLRLAPSTYSLGGTASDQQLIAAARGHAGDDLVVTGLLACRLLGLVDVPDDGWFPGLGLGWEVESRRHHAQDDSFDATLARHDRFAGFGLQLLHVTPKRARRLGSGYAKVLAEAVAARRLAVQPEPANLMVRPHDALHRELRRPPGVIHRSSGPVSGACWS